MNRAVIVSVFALLLLVLGGGIWLGVSPLQPAVSTVRAELPDSRFPR